MEGFFSACEKSRQLKEGLTCEAAVQTVRQHTSAGLIDSQPLGLIQGCPAPSRSGYSISPGKGKLQANLRNQPILRVSKIVDFNKQRASRAPIHTALGLTCSASPTLRLACEKSSRGGEGLEGNPRVKALMRQVNACQNEGGCECARARVCVKCIHAVTFNCASSAPKWVEGAGRQVLTAPAELANRAPPRPSIPRRCRRREDQLYPPF